MKKFVSILCALAMLATVVPAVLAEADYVDAYTSASTTKTSLEGDALAAAVELLVAKSADMATLAESQAEGYAAPDSALAQIMSVNPDGSVGLSTISQWRYMVSDDGEVVQIQLTYGQNALNLGEAGARGSLLVGIDGAWYLLHLEVTEVVEQVYSDEAFEAGEFNAHYSGSEAQLSSYDIFLRVLSIESTYAIRF
ncbi:MAG: hypothetical protein ACOYI5_04030 [Christensenellales bacterium]